MTICWGLIPRCLLPAAHPHTRLNLPNIQKLSLKPILFTQVPAVDNVVSKLFSFIDEVSWPATVNPTPDQIKSVISKSFAPYLKVRFTSPKAPPNGVTASAAPISSTPAMLHSWNQATAALITVLPAEVLFPLIDMWRLASLDPATGSWATAPSTSPWGGPIGAILPKAIEVLQSGSTKGTRNYLLTVLRLLCNAFSSPALSRALLTDSRAKPNLTSVLVQSLLYEDAVVGTAAASLAFNVGAWLQSGRVEAVKNGRDIRADVLGEDEEWEIELVSAVVEALGRETRNEEVGELLL